MIANLDFAAAEDLVQRLDHATAEQDTQAITSAVKQALIDWISAGPIELPPDYLKSRATTYARRLVHASEHPPYSITAMTWGPGQGTPLHDHNDLWCVEAVVTGTIEIEHYDLLERDGERYRFRRQGAVSAGVGSAGRLIPPFDYHTIKNPTEVAAVTMHVYGGLMNNCCIFEPADDGADGWYERRQRELTFDAA